MMDALLDFGTDVLVTPPGYVDKPGETVFEIGLTSGLAFVRLPLKFREDSDFIIRSVKASPIAIGQDGTVFVAGQALDFTFSFTDSEFRYLSSQQANYQLAAGSGTMPEDLAVPVYVPAGGVILIDITGNVDAGSHGCLAQIVFCGIRRFRGVA